MMKFTRSKCVASVITVAAVGAVSTMALASPPTNFGGEALVVGDLNKLANVSGHNIKFETSALTDASVVRLNFGAGGSSGWHHHPGMVLVQVASGKVRVFDGECHRHTYGPGLRDGSVFVEGDQAHQVVSVDGPAVAYATAIVENQEPKVFRIEDNAPACASGPGIRKP